MRVNAWCAKHGAPISASCSRSDDEDCEVKRLRQWAAVEGHEWRDPRHVCFRLLEWSYEVNADNQMPDAVREKRYAMLQDASWYIRHLEDRLREEGLDV